MDGSKNVRERMFLVDLIKVLEGKQGVVWNIWDRGLWFHVGVLVVVKSW